MITFLALAVALTAVQQTQHDDTERAAYQRLQAQTQSVFEIDHPSKKMVDDYKRARGCYTKLHLYKVQNCDAALAKVDADLAGSKE